MPPPTPCAGLRRIVAGERVRLSRSPRSGCCSACRDTRARRAAEGGRPGRPRLPDHHRAGRSAAPCARRAARAAGRDRPRRRAAQLAGARSGTGSRCSTAGRPVARLGGGGAARLHPDAALFRRSDRRGAGWWRGSRRSSCSARSTAWRGASAGCDGALSRHRATRLRSITRCWPRRPRADLRAALHRPAAALGPRHALDWLVWRPDSGSACCPPRSRSR